MSSIPDDSKFNDSPESGYLVEEVGRDDDGSFTSNRSDASTLGDGTLNADAGPKWRDLVDFTSPLVCRVVMASSNGFRARVCGQEAGGCRRSSHGAKVLANQGRADKGFYVSYGLKHGRPDGDYEGPLISSAHAMRLQTEDTARNLEELQRFTAHEVTFVGRTEVPGPEVLTREDDDPDASGTPGTVDADATPRTGSNLGSRGEPPRGLPPVSQAGLAARHRSVLFGPDMSKEPPPPARAPLDVLYGLDRTDGMKILGRTSEEVLAYLNEGWTYRETFTTHGAAFLWFQDRKAPLPGPPDVVVRSVVKSANTAEVAPPDPSRPLAGGGVPTESRPEGMFGLTSPDGHRTVAPSTDQVTFLEARGFTLTMSFASTDAAEAWAAAHSAPKAQGAGATLAGKGTRFATTTPDEVPHPSEGWAHETRTGPDKSQTAQEVFGVHVSRIPEVDKFVLPAGMTGDGRERTMDCAVDVCSLPGVYQTSEAGNYGDLSGTEALMAYVAGRKETGLHMSYRAPSNNALKQIKNKEDLADFTERVGDTWEEAEEGMKSQIIATMDSMGYSYDSIEHYLQVGVLPRIIRDTHDNYVHLLMTVAGHATTVAAAGWRTSLPYFMLKLHSDKLLLIRRQSATYRELVLRNYAYMRDARKERFYNQKLNRNLWSLSDATPGATATGVTGREAQQACPTCRRTRTHPATGPCPLEPLTPAERTTVLAGLRFREAQLAMTYVARTLAANPTMDHAQLVIAARAAAS
jgi:hypothetical protein